ncbi:hypothetical protein UCDDS831_g08113 [Diplodia seriata]|uniref:Uncharacterized protein n=1 Tax=Diplodia seriata TaxID=420778 RepID=A0A0G2DVE8_9PEZI|nr:hypothetical protein UCDDS831_g08113 [Diplodia seriata]
MAPNDNWLNRSVQGAVAGAGGYVGGFINSMGNGVSGVGRGIGSGCAPFPLGPSPTISTAILLDGPRADSTITSSISNTARGWGDGVRGYGNGVKDATRASGRRAPTAANPLGLPGGSTQSAAMMKSKVKGITNNGPTGTAGNPLGLK